MAAMANMYNKTSATVGGGPTVLALYNKTRDSGLASGQHQADALDDSLATATVHNETSTSEGLIHHNDGTGRRFCITKQMAGRRTMAPRVARLVRVLLTELA